MILSTTSGGFIIIEWIIALGKLVYDLLITIGSYFNMPPLGVLVLVIEAIAIVLILDHYGRKGRYDPIPIEMAKPE